MAELFIGDRMTTPTSSSKIDISPATVTLVSNSFVYDGGVKTQAVQSVVLNEQTLVEGTDYIVTNYFKTNAGTYTLAVRGIRDYNGVATANWNIAKAQGSVSLNKNNISLNTNVVSDTIVVTRAGNGTISATSSDTNVATVSVSENIVTVTGVINGDTTITVSVAAGDNHLATSTTCSVNVNLISTTLSDNTPEQIKAAAQGGIASSLWSVGDMTAEINIDAVGNMATTSARAFIIGFDHNSSKEGTNRIHFQFGKKNIVDIAFVDAQYNNYKTTGTWFNMNNSGNNSGGWSSSRMRNTVCLIFKSALPSAWQNVIASTTKYTDNTGGGSDTASYVTSTSDDIFLLAEYEVFGARTHANSAERKNQLQYDYYKNGNSKIKYKHDDTSTACRWWLRSPNVADNYAFCKVEPGGTNSQSGLNPYYSLGFAPGFCIA